MTKGNGSAKALGILADIAVRLANITPEQFVVPGLEREKDAHVVAEADDDIKRLFTLRATLTDECNGLVTHCQQMAENALTDIFRRNPRDVVEEMDVPGSPLFEAKAALQKLEIELKQLTDLREIVDNVFWLEVRRKYPELLGKSCISIYSDWSLCWQDKDDDSDVSVRILSISGRGLPPELAEFLGQRAREH